MDPTPWYVFLVMFSPLWWTVIIGASILTIWALEKDRGDGATFIIGVAALLLIFCGSFPVLQWISTNFVLFLLYVLGYFVAGTVWCIWRWYCFVGERSEEYNLAKLDFLRMNGVDGKDMPEDLKSKWSRQLMTENRWTTRLYNGQTAIQIRPMAWQYSTKILTWMTYWPWSMFWWVVADFVRSIFKQIQVWIGELLESISRYRFRGVENDYAVKEPEKVEAQSESFGYTGRKRV